MSLKRPEVFSQIINLTAHWFLATLPSISACRIQYVLHSFSAPTLSSCSLRRRWISLTTVSFCFSECSGSSKISFLHSSMASFSCSMSDATNEPWNGSQNKGIRVLCAYESGYGLEINTETHTAKKNTLTIGLEKWSSARPRSMVRSGLLFLFPENSSGLAS